MECCYHVYVHVQKYICIYTSHVVSGHDVNTIIIALYLCVQMECDVCQTLYCVLAGSAVLSIVCVSALNTGLDG